MPFALKIGVPYDVFWHLNPRTLQPFIMAYEQKQKDDMERLDYSAWLNGLYVMRAVGAAFSDKVKYFEKPLSNQEQPEPKSNDEAAAAGFAIYAAEFNKQFEKGGDNSGN